MVEEGFKRKLAAILSADVQGYSLLMDQDEEGTIRNLKTFRRSMTDIIQQYRGRVVDSPGDNLLAEFPSVVDAVKCAVEVQRDFAERNAELAEDRRMQFRIGVNLGDVVDDAGRIYGDGVNIAARVESMAEAGGVCITGRAYDQVANKLGLDYEFLGEHTVKNISTPIRVYRVLSHPGAAAHRVVMAKKATGTKWRRFSIVAVVLIVVAAVVLWGWQNFLGLPEPVEAASVEKMKHPLPDKPSIVVLPFANLSGQTDDEYIADGITNDIITAISKVGSMFVIARNSAFTYKNKPVKIKEVSEEFGVQYVLEGSIERSGERFRVTSKLIDALSGNHMWVERFERKMEDLFNFKDDITQKILAALSIELTVGERLRMYTNQTENLEAYIQFTKGIHYLSKWEYKENTSKARHHLEKSVDLDDKFAGALEKLAFAHYLEWMMYWSPNREESFKAYQDLSKRAISLDASSAFAHAIQGRLHRHQRQYDKAIAELTIALDLDPNNSIYHYNQGRNYHYARKPNRAIEHLKMAMRLNPFFSNTYLINLGQSQHAAGHYEEALHNYDQYVARKIKAREEIPWWVHYCYIFAYLELGKIDNAFQYYQKVSSMSKKYGLVPWAMQWLGYKGSDIDRLLKRCAPLLKMAAEAQMKKKQ